MITGLRNSFQIEDLGGHSAETVTALQKVLAGNPKTAPDPKRAGFYEVESPFVTYYIHVSPVTAKIFLLATWPIKDVPVGATQAA